MQIRAEQSVTDHSANKNPKGKRHITPSCPKFPATPRPRLITIRNRIMLAHFHSCACLHVLKYSFNSENSYLLRLCNTIIGEAHMCDVCSPPGIRLLDYLCMPWFVMILLYFISFMLRRNADASHELYDHLGFSHTTFSRVG